MTTYEKRRRFGIYSPKPSRFVLYLKKIFIMKIPAPAPAPAPPLAPSPAPAPTPAPAQLLLLKVDGAPLEFGDLRA